MDDTFTLNIAICDPDDGIVTLLGCALRGFRSVGRIEQVGDLQGLRKLLQTTSFNTVFIDPLSLGLDDASNYIFSVRDVLPFVVFVLTIDRTRVRRQREEFFAGRRERFHHYFVLDKLTPLAFLRDEIAGLLRMCQFDLSRAGCTDRLHRGPDPIGDPSTPQGHPSEAEIRDSLLLNLTKLERRLESSRDIENVRKDALELIREVRKIERLGEIDPGAALGKARSVLEVIVTPIFQKHTGDSGKPLFDMIDRLSKDGVLPKKIASYFNYIRILGNQALHFQEGNQSPLTALDVRIIAMMTANIVDWFVSCGA